MSQLKRSKYSMEQILGYVFDEETCTLLVSTKEEKTLGNSLANGLKEIVSAEEINENIKNSVKAHADAVMLQHANTFKKLAEYENQSCQCSPAVVAPSPTKDNRVRHYAKAIRKELAECAKNQSISLLNKRMDIHAETAGKIQAAQNSDLFRLEKDQSKLSHELKLIREELKVKPVHIKETKIVERFDHRLVIFNIVLLFLNICLLFKGN